MLLSQALPYSFLPAARDIPCGGPERLADWADRLALKGATFAFIRAVTVMPTIIEDRGSTQ